MIVFMIVSQIIISILNERYYFTKPLEYGRLVS
jgi:hypothetical protein